MKRFIFLIIIAFCLILKSYSQNFFFETVQMNELAEFGLDEDNSKMGEVEECKSTVLFNFGDKVSITAVDNKLKAIWAIEDILFIDFSLIRGDGLMGESINLNIYKSKEKKNDENPDVMLIIRPQKLDYKFGPGQDGDLMTKCTNFVLNISNRTLENYRLNQIAYRNLFQNLMTYRGETCIMNTGVH